MQGLLYYGHYSSRYSDALPYMLIGKDNNGRGGYVVSNYGIHMGPFSTIEVNWYSNGQGSGFNSVHGAAMVVPVTGGNRIGQYPQGVITRGSVTFGYGSGNSGTSYMDVSGVNEACFLMLSAGGNTSGDSIDDVRLYVRHIKFS